MTSRIAAARREHAPWLILAIVSLPVFIGALDLTIISAVLPEVILSLNLPVKEYLDQASWAVSGYLLAYAISMTFTGRLSDLIGRRAVYITCLAIFMIGSYLVTAYDSTLVNGWIARFYNVVLGQRPRASKSAICTWSSPGALSRRSARARWSPSRWRWSAICSRLPAAPSRSV